MSLIRIEPGKFDMGSPESEHWRRKDEQRHAVQLTHPFYIAESLVTRGEFAAFVADTRYRTDAEKDGSAIIWNGRAMEDVKNASWRNVGFQNSDNHPVVLVSYSDARAFCAWLSRKEQRDYRLPTEAEWEYACRAGTSGTFFWGNENDKAGLYANVADKDYTELLHIYEIVVNYRDGYAFTSPVKAFRPNPWGLYDMIGNAGEWCQDVYGPYSGDAKDPTAPPADAHSEYVIRGGSWGDDLGSSRCASRFMGNPHQATIFCGFRIVMSESK